MQEEMGIRVANQDLSNGDRSAMELRNNKYNGSV